MGLKDSTISIEDLGEKDVLVNVHGYEKWDKGLTRQETESIISEFPGDVYGVAEHGYQDDLYGSEHMEDENVLITAPRTGHFEERNLGIRGANHLVITGGHLGQCHKEVYKILEDEANEDTEIIFPPEACFGHVASSAPVQLLYSLENLQKGNLEGIEQDQEFFIKDVAEKTRLEEYDWNRTSIQGIDLRNSEDKLTSPYQSDSGVHDHHR